MKKKKIIVLIVLVLLVITALIIGYLYLATDTFKTNKELFFKSLANTQLIDNEFSSKYKSIFESESSSNYSSVGNIIYSTSTQDNNTNVADIKQLFNIKYNSLKNRNLEQDYADYTLNTNNEELMTVRYLRDGKTYGIKIENVLKKYLAVENNNLKEFFSKLGVVDSENVPNYISNISLKELFKVDENQFDSVKSTYVNILLNNLTQNNFSKTKNGDDTITIKLSLTEREFANILKQELETLKNDSNTLNILIEKANMAGYSFKLEDVTTYIQKQIDKINSNTDITDEHFLNISITEKNRKIFKIEIAVYYDKVGATKEETNNTKEETSLSLDLTQNNKIVFFVKDNDNTSKIDISYGYEANKLWENIDMISTDNQKNTNQAIGKIKHQIALNENKIVQDATVNIYTEESKQTIQINVNDSKELKQDIQIEKLTDQNSEILNNKSKEELEKLIKAIGERINYVYGNKISSIFDKLSNFEKKNEVVKNYEDKEIQEKIELAASRNIALKIYGNRN